MATTRTDLWPPFGLIVTSGDLRLTPVSDDDLPGLVDLALDGIHSADMMPFDVPWTQAPADELPRRYAQHYWEERARFAPERFSLDFAVRRGDDLVGIQGCSADHFAITRTAETGSWLAARFQGQGVGTRMRTVICTLLFDHLGATQVTSGAFVDNPASLAVSRKLGYRANGVVRRNRLGTLALNQQLALDPGDLVRGEPIEVVGLEPLRRFLGLG